MALQNTNSVYEKEEFDRLTEKLMAVIEEREQQGDSEKIDNRNLQCLIENLLKVYSHKVQMADQDPAHAKENIQPLADNNNLSQTAAVIFVSELLQQKDIELFEVQMFRSIG